MTDIVSLSAVGSLREDLPPGKFLLVDQFIDRSFAREKTFFGRGCVAHVGMADPVSARMGDVIAEQAEKIGVDMMRGGTYLVMEGPQFSTRAESELYRQWGCSVIGMTNMPEAKLAREAEMCYASIAMVTDYDCWHDDHDSVTVDAVVAVMTQNAAKARALVKAIILSSAGSVGFARQAPNVLSITPSSQRLARATAGFSPSSMPWPVAFCAER